MAHRSGDFDFLLSVQAVIASQALNINPSGQNVRSEDIDRVDFASILMTTTILWPKDCCLQARADSDYGNATVWPISFILVMLSILMQNALQEQCAGLFIR